MLFELESQVDRPSAPGRIICPRRRRIPAIIAIAIGFGSTLWAQEQVSKNQGGEVISLDELPRHAVARLGTRRLRHNKGVRSLAFSRDGLFLATGGWDFEVRVWQADTGHLTKRLLAHRWAVVGLAWSSDGRRLASRGIDDVINIWNVPSGQVEMKFLESTNLNSLYDLSLSTPLMAFSSDGSHLITEQVHETVVWSLDTRKTVHTWPQLLHPALSTDARLLAGLDPSTRRVRIIRMGTWDEEKSIALPPDWRKDLWTVSASMHFLEEGRALYYIVRLSSSASVFKIADGSHSPSPLKAKIARQEKVECSPDGSKILLWSEQLVTVFNRVTGEEVTRLASIAGPFSAAVFSHDGTKFVTGTENGVVEIHVLPRGDARPTLIRHRGPVLQVEITPDGKHLFTQASEDGPMIWEFEQSSQPVRRQLPDAEINVPRSRRPVFGITPEGQLAVAYSDQRDHWFRQGRNEAVLLPAEMAPLIAFNRDVTIAAGGVWQPFRSDSRLRCWSLDRDEPVVSLPIQCMQLHPYDFIHVEFSRDNRWLLSMGGGDQLLRFWDLVEGKPLHLPLGFAGRSAPLAATWSPDASQVAVLCPDAVLLVARETASVIRAISSSNEQIKTRPRLWKPRRGIAFSSDGRVLAAIQGRDHDRVALWEVATGSQLCVLDGSDAPVCSLCFFPDGRRIASGAQDGTTLIWDVAEFVKDRRG